MSQIQLYNRGSLALWGCAADFVSIPYQVCCTCDNVTHYL